MAETPDPFEVFHGASMALLARASGGWDDAADYAARALRIAPLAMRLGALDLAAFARVMTDRADPRRFEALAPGQGSGDRRYDPAVLLPWPDPAEAWDAEDLVAISLVRDRFWRLTGAAWGISAEDRAPGLVLRLRRRRPRAWLRELVCWRAGKALPGPHPNPPPRGLFVLDLAAVDWTRRGILSGVETIEILDEPATGQLGATLRRLNPRIGSPGGVGLRGIEQDVARCAA